MTECTGTGALRMWKKNKKKTFSSTKLLTRVTVADKLVLVNHFDEITIVHYLMCCLFAVSS